jgi:hypothetical protein
MIEYIKAKKAAKAQQKEIENRLEADARENERMGNLLSKYFDCRGRGLSKSQIMEVNKYLKEYVVLSNDQEINTYTSMMLTYSTIAVDRLAALMQNINKDLDAGKVITKSDAGIVAKNVIINKPKIESRTLVNGRLQSRTMVAEKKYVVNINPEVTPIIQSTKYENECEEVMINIDNQISKWSHVETVAYANIEGVFSL